MKSDFLSKITDIREDIIKIDKFKAGVDATNDALAQKADAQILEQVLEKKASKRDIELLEKKLLELPKVDTQPIENVQVKITQALDVISKDMSAKSNIKDVCKLLDLKANSAYVDKVINQHKQEICTKLDMQTYEDDKEKQAYVLDVLIKEVCIGRWIWKSGELKTNNSVPWELQASNTNPDNFLWEKGKSSILVVHPGL